MVLHFVFIVALCDKKKTKTWLSSKLNPFSFIWRELKNLSGLGLFSQRYWGIWSRLSDRKGLGKISEATATGHIKYLSISWTLVLSFYLLLCDSSDLEADISIDIFRLAVIFRSHCCLGLVGIILGHVCHCRWVTFAASWCSFYCLHRGARFEQRWGAVCWRTSVTLCIVFIIS